MDKVFDIAKNKGSVEIKGYVTQGDIEECDFLLGWYERLGFEICEPDGKQIVPAKKMVVKVF